MKLLNKNQIKEASKILRDGGLIAFPTETVFGLAVIFDNKESYDRLITVKRRPPEKPFTLMCSSISEVYRYIDKNSISTTLIEKFMPGEFTLITKAKSNLPSWVLSKEGNVGVRVPNDEFVQQLIKEVGKPLLVPSANRSGEKPLINSRDVAKTFSSELDAIIEGESTGTVPSTIVLVDEKYHLIRLGKISEDEIKKVLEEKL